MLILVNISGRFCTSVQCAHCLWVAPGSPPH
ncbi:hypothetical protein M5D96_013465 [Drosophila gunungcola]|uniref:Uncharacterized protein n=1 Tax=Drosophila gunungcola TaxID=103775 RepID=A0A9Q0BJJ5_9MUSC|nr:hypothetical protein M5D96_013465 [Drosophila gunungcola]